MAAGLSGAAVTSFAPKNNSPLASVLVISGRGVAPQMCEFYAFRELQGGDVPMTEMFGTFALSVGAAVRVQHSESLCCSWRQ
jgi:hypothetical protein